MAEGIQTDAMAGPGAQSDLSTSPLAGILQGLLQARALQEQNQQQDDAVKQQAFQNAQALAVQDANATRIKNQQDLAAATIQQRRNAVDANNAFNWDAAAQKRVFARETQLVQGGFQGDALAQALSEEHLLQANMPYFLPHLNAGGNTPDMPGHLAIPLPQSPATDSNAAAADTSPLRTAVQETPPGPSMPPVSSRPLPTAVPPSQAVPLLSPARGVGAGQPVTTPAPPTQGGPATPGAGGVPPASTSAQPKQAVPVISGGGVGQPLPTPAPPTQGGPATPGADAAQAAAQTGIGVLPAVAAAIAAKNAASALNGARTDQAKAQTARITAQTKTEDLTRDVRIGAITSLEQYRRRMADETERHHEQMENLLQDRQSAVNAYNGARAALARAASDGVADPYAEKNVIRRFGGLNSAANSLSDQNGYLARQVDSLTKERAQIAGELRSDPPDPAQSPGEYAKWSLMQRVGRGRLNDINSRLPELRSSLRGTSAELSSYKSLMQSGWNGGTKINSNASQKAVRPVTGSARGGTP